MTIVTAQYFKRTVFLIGAVAAALVASPAQAQLCYRDSNEANPGQGVPVTWLDTASKKIDYYTFIPQSGGSLPSDRAAVLEAIKAAFQAYEDIPCSTLQFNHAGALDTLVTQRRGAILVYFAHDESAPAIGGAYIYNMSWLTVAQGEIDEATIALNAKDFAYTIGAEPNKIDIQTAVMQLIPPMLGYFVGQQPGGAIEAIKFNEINHTLDARQIAGAQYSYFKADNGCVRPEQPSPCVPHGSSAGDGGSSTAGDAGTGAASDASSGGSSGGGAGDSGVSTSDRDSGSGVVGGSDAGASGDASTTAPSDDDGCCRVGHLRAADLPPFLVVALFLLSSLRRRRSTQAGRCRR